MLDWLDGVAGPDYAPAIVWTLAALVLLVIVLVIVRLIRSMTFGTFVAGGRNRKTRLAVMDATAVDSHRRLVLVRRDDIEHLLLIGGPTDVVVERDIRLAAPRRPALTGNGVQQPVAAARPRQPQPAPAPQPVPPRPAPAQQQASASTHLQQPATPAPRKSPVVVPLQAYGATMAAVRLAPAPPSGRDSLDDTLMNELQASLDDEQAKPAVKAPAPSLDDEMTRLLGELSSHKR